jgi:hypothetical protein
VTTVLVQAEVCLEAYRLHKKGAQVSGFGGAVYMYFLNGQERFRWDKCFLKKNWHKIKWFGALGRVHVPS